MGLYAEGTEVSPERSRAEIETTLRRYGADQFVSGFTQERGIVGFTCHGRQVRFEVPLPRHEDYAVTPKGVKRNRDAMQAAAQKEERRRWRALALAIKAKLEVVETGIASFEEEFAANIVLPDGSLLGQWLEPQLEQVYASGQMPPTLALGR